MYLSATETQIMKLQSKSTRVKAPAYNHPGPQASTQSTAHDVVSPNPQGRDAAECRRVKGFLKCKEYKKVGTLNTRTLKEEYKRKELANIFNKINLSILAISDHKIVHSEDANIGSWKIALSSQQVHGETLKVQPLEEWEL